MSGDNFSGEGCPALGDVTNRPVKRGFSLVSGDSGAKSQDRRGKCGIDGGGDAVSAKQVCLGVENLVKGKCTARHEGHGVKKGTIPLFKDKKARGSSPVHDKLGSACGSVFSAVVRSQETLNVSHSSPKVSRIEMNARSVLEVADASRDSCTSIVSTLSSQVGEKSSEGIKARDERADVVMEADVDPIRESTAQGPVTQVLSNCDEDLRIGKLASNSYGSIEWSRLPNSQGLKNFELTRCQTLEGNGCDNFCAEADLLKSCSCSFCLKAAHIWSDLHYQDIKGRISGKLCPLSLHLPSLGGSFFFLDSREMVLILVSFNMHGDNLIDKIDKSHVIHPSAVSKSRKEANTLVQKTATAKDVIHVSGNSNKSPNLEYVLMNQWRSLFLRMEDILVHEGRELQSSYCELKDMREKCKMDLDSTNKMPSNRH